MILAALFSGGPVQLPGGSAHLSSAFVTAVLISVPSVIIAVASYGLSVRAKRETARAALGQIDAEAYNRARGLYESAIDTLRRELADTRSENARLHTELAGLHADLAAARRSQPRHPGRNPPERGKTP